MTTTGMGVGGLDRAMKISDTRSAIRLALKTLSDRFRCPCTGRQPEIDLARAIVAALEELECLERPQISLFGPKERPHVDPRLQIDPRSQIDVRIARKELARVRAIAESLGLEAECIDLMLRRSIKPMPHYDRNGGRKNKREREGIWRVLIWLRSEILNRGGSL